jgi:hypothetical protein
LPGTGAVKQGGDFDSVVGRLKELRSEDANAFRNQLLVAWQVFAPAS